MNTDKNKIKMIEGLIQEWEGKVPACFSNKDFCEELLEIIKGQ